MIKLLVIVMAALIFGGCASGYGEWGQATWCNKRFLQNREDVPVADPKHLRFAKEGYLYAVAGALVLQQADKEGNDYHFETPSGLRLIDDPPQGTYGFDVKAFDVLEDPNTLESKEVIIAFVGSNDWSDWIWTNFLFSQQQHESARAYVKSIAERRQGKRIVVTGYSLGGALAVHVTKHEETKKLVSQAWVFNPSPKTWVSGELDKRIWLGAAKGEFLSSIRSPFFTFLPGINKIGSPEPQTAEGFYLIKTSGIYGHFRWVLARNMLHFADYAMAPNNTPPSTPPLEILRQSRFRICNNPA